MSGSDKELMERCKNGDMSAFDLLVQRHKAPLINFIYRSIGDPETAEDLAQETFIRIYKNIGKYRKDIAAFRTWMYRIAANLCRNELRNRGRRWSVLVNSAIGEQDDDPVVNAADVSAGPDGQLEEKELQEILANTLSRLPERLRNVLILRDIEGMPYEEIAEIMGKPLGTVKSRLNRARLMLKDKIAAYVQL